MVDSFSFSTDSADEQAMNAALADVENSLIAFEKIVEKRLSRLNVLARTDFASTTSRNNAIGRSISRVFDVLSNGGPQVRTPDFNPNANKNRFPTSQGQIFADLSQILRGLGGRNL